ncbi:polysaccharide pyruvyl transferase family protein [Mycolicibacterium vaccae]|uniref:polysaccharide pyruvyl transferase family protein n=1 Tax=Mycolicibacterium vaccae TaxID=1810 RepID=UPI003CF88F0B
MTTQPAAPVAYLGWQGRGNLGDDAIYDAVRAQLAGATFIDQPVLLREYLSAVATRRTRSIRQGAQVIGGGTLLGRRHWRRLATRGMRWTRRCGSYAIGAGVEDPVFTGRKSGSGRAELERWVPLLSQFRTVSVRGPRSAELLADAGFDARVSGDPALLLPAPEVAAEDGLIGVNLGFGDDLWGHDPAAVAEEMRTAVQHLATRGHRFVGILMNAADERWTSIALRDVSAPIVHPPDARTAAQQLARCSLTIVSRLHAGILAAVSATPTIALEYQPKCRDFALSIDDERSLLRTDKVTSTALIDKATDTLDDAAAIRTRTATAVSRLQQHLRTEYTDLRSHIGLPPA